MADSSLIMGAQFSQSVPAYLPAKSKSCPKDIRYKNDLYAGKCRMFSTTANSNWLQGCNLPVLNTEKKVISDFVMSFGVLIPLVYRINTRGRGKVYFLSAVANLFFNGGNF